MARFVHAADLQLGKASGFLGPEARPRFAQARLDSIAAIGRVVAEHQADFVVVAGDVFDSNDVDRRRVVGRALDAFGALGVPVFLLPGNHDHLGLRSVWHAVADAAPANVTVLDSYAPVQAMPGVEIVGAPWTSKRPLADLAGEALASLPATQTGNRRVLVAHGVVDDLFPVADRIDQALINLGGLESAVADGRVDYVALGDRHSVTAVGRTGQIWYSGTPEPTAWDETEPGHVLVVDLGGTVEVTKHAVATWKFDTCEVALDSQADIRSLDARLRALPCKDRIAMRIVAEGSLSVSERAWLSEVIEELAPAFGALELHDTERLLTRADHFDPAELGVTGYAREAFDELVAAATGAPVDEEAVEALVLLERLARGRDIASAA